MKIKSASTAVYASGPGQPGTIGDADPVTLLPIGATVGTMGDPVKNAHGVSYTPVSVEGRDGVHYVRTSSTEADYVPPAPKSAPSARGADALAERPETQKGTSGIPWWVFVVAGVGVLGAGFVGYRLIRGTNERKIGYR